MITKVQPTSLSAERAIAQIDKALVLITQANTFDDIQKIRDTVHMTNAFLRTKQAADLLGERALDVQRKAERLRIEADRKLGELVATLKPEERGKALSESRVSSREAAQAEAAARVPKKQADVYLKIRHATNMEARTADLARLGRLDNNKRIDAILALRTEPSIAAACGSKNPSQRSGGEVLETLLTVQEAWRTSANVRVFSDWLNAWVTRLKGGR